MVVVAPGSRNDEAYSGGGGGGGWDDDDDDVIVFIKWFNKIDGFFIRKSIVYCKF